MVGIGLLLAAAFARYFLLAGATGVVRWLVYAVGAIGVIMILAGLAMALREKKGRTEGPAK